MNYITKRHIIKITTDISVYYCITNHIVIFENSFIRKVLRLKTRLIFENDKKILKITRESLSSISNNEKKKLKAIQATQVALIKQMLLETSLFSCKKLNLIGVGFRVSVLNVLDFNLLYFKLGYSHAIYFKVPKGLKVFCLKSNKLFIIGNSYLFVTQIAALIRSYKAPEPYKGKGILYASEKVVLKEGKKV
jgi:large subunit ribosomal protein L6